VIHLYALAEGVTADDLEGTTGIDAVPLQPMSAPPLVAVVSEHEQAPRVSRERALAHAAATLDVCRRCPATPVRYGAHHADATALRGAVDERSAELLASIHRVGGCLEVVVRFAELPEPSPSDAPGPPDEGAEPADSADAGAGRAYLEGRRRREQAEREARRVAAAQLQEATSGLDARAARVVERQDGRQGPERCLLVDHRDAEAVASLARRLAREDSRLVVGGPWPPYTFA
jgi:hypothetical protein